MIQIAMIATNIQPPRLPVYIPHSRINWQGKRVVLTVLTHTIVKL
jgi:hypothetical protein